VVEFVWRQSIARPWKPPAACKIRISEISPTQAELLRTLSQISLAWQQRSVVVEFVWYHSVAWPPKHRDRRKTKSYLGLGKIVLAANVLKLQICLTLSGVFLSHPVSSASSVMFVVEWTTDASLSTSDGPLTFIPSLCLSVCLYVFVSVCVTLCLPLCVCVCVSICASVCLSLCYAAFKLLVWNTSMNVATKVTVLTCHLQEVTHSVLLMCYYHDYYYYYFYLFLTSVS